MIKVTEETKAVLSAERGRVVGFVKSDEPGKISLAVPADRAVMTPREARELAGRLMDEAAKAERIDARPKWGDTEQRLRNELLNAVRRG